MGGNKKRRKKKGNDRRLDLLFNEIEIKKKEKNLKEVKEITLNVLKEKSSPQLRLKKKN